ncbi:hypothetical protein E2C01_050173 [Portunus trituberculatus]|uniref:Uncharacterized protein n=1 Tax=Portunus trituberculatus TaxID=210409 RepID=A0A5B7G7K0_PORTR|nr:hypothetical protein [Portunus trituberculatus]
MNKAGLYPTNIIISSTHSAGGGKANKHYTDIHMHYIRVRIEEERNFEKDVVNKSKDGPKLFY